MKKIILFLSLCLFLSMDSFSQIKISQMTPLSGFCDTCWVPIVRGTSNFKARLNQMAWTPLGNLGTTSGTHFIGNKDAVSLEFRVNNIRSGFVAYAPTTVTGQNTFYGYGAGQNVNQLTTNALIGIGYQALNNQAWGGSNIAIGFQAMYNTNYPGSGSPTASEGIAIGVTSAYNQTTGFKNCFVGHYTDNVIGSENSIFGIHGFESNYSGSNNAGSGNSSLRWNIRGSFNTAVGNSSNYLGSTVISSITVAAGGSGYTDGTYPLTIPAPKVSSIPGIPSVQATGTVTISGGVAISATITDPGNNYGYSASLPAITLTGAGPGTGATFTAVLTSSANNTTVGSASMVYNQYGIGNVAVGVESGYGAGGNEASLFDDYAVFLGQDASRHSSIARTTKLSNIVGLGYNSKVSVSNTGALGGTGSEAMNWGINTHSARKKLDVVGGDILVHELTIGRGSGSVATNTAIGTNALFANTSGSLNTVIGYEASKNSTTGLLNTIIGVEAHQGNGAHNVAIGYNALKNAGTAGFVNSMVAIGSVAIGSGTGSWGSIAIGMEALYNNTTTSAANVYDWNTAVGFRSGYTMTNGRFNTNVGGGAGYNITSGQFNTSLGVRSMGNQLTAGAVVMTGNLNTAIGYNSGALLSTGSNNVILGSNDGSTIATLSNRIIISDGQGNIRVSVDDNGNVILGTVSEHADNAAAITAGLPVGTIYRTGDTMKVVH
jgi:trimeric autotransporter adhesin